MYDDEFTLPLGQLKTEGGEMHQYCNIYFKRLEQLKPAVKENAELKWNK